MDVLVNRFSDYLECCYHEHDFLEIAYVQAGHGWHVLGKEIMLCGPGDVYVVDHGDAHMFMSELNTPLTICNLLFIPDYFDHVLRGRAPLLISSGTSCAPSARRISPAHWPYPSRAWSCRRSIACMKTC